MKKLWKKLSDDVTLLPKPIIFAIIAMIITTTLYLWLSVAILSAHSSIFMAILFMLPPFGFYVIMFKHSVWENHTWLFTIIIAIILSIVLTVILLIQDHLWEVFALPVEEWPVLILCGATLLSFWALIAGTLSAWYAYFYYLYAAKLLDINK